MSVQAQAALIAGISAFVGVLVGEVFLRQRNRQAKKESIQSTFEKYAQPIAASSADLFWRLREVFGKQRAGTYLKGEEHLTKYERYKAISTLYRIAGLIGWIRALRRELFFLPSSKSVKVKPLDEALQAFGAALAVGGHVEMQRVKSLMSVWDVPAHYSDESIARSGSLIDRQLDAFLHKENVASAKRLPPDEQMKLVHDIARTFSESLDCVVTPEKIGQSLPGAVRCLAIREAYVYRDWQSAIGDTVLRETQGRLRRFEVLGFKDFESAYIHGTEEERVWLGRLNEIICDLDVSGDKREDARIDQLHEVYRATARIIVALSQTKHMKSCIYDDVREAAEEALAGGVSKLSAVSDHSKKRSAQS